MTRNWPPKGTKRFLCCLTPVDDACISYIMAQHGQSRQAEAVRFALEGQSERCRRYGSERYRRLADGVEIVSPERLRKLHIWLPQATFDAIDTVRHICGLTTKSEAVRLAIRAQAVTEGYKLEVTV